MSFARAKITRFNEKPNPNPNATTGIKSKSQIPKINKPLSQPQSPRESPQTQSSPTQKRRKNGTGEGANVGKPCNLTSVQENSINSDDYKDALDDKTEMDNVDDSLKDSTQISITVKDSLASRSSNSGIPLPLKNSISKQSTRTSPRGKPDQAGECNKLVASPKRTLELQFLTKKKRLDQLRKELESKQKPVFDVYESLIQIKKKLEESGKVVPLETLKLVDFEKFSGRPTLVASSDTTLCCGESIKGDVGELTAEFLKNIKIEMSAIPQTCLDLGSYLIKQRTEVINYLGNLKEKGQPVAVEEFLQDTNRLNLMIDETVARQTGRIERVMGDINSLFEKNNLVVANQIIHDLERKIKHQQEEIIRLTNELNEKERELKEWKEKKDDVSHKIIEENNSLKERVKTLEAELQAKKKKISDQGMNTKTAEQRVEILTKQTHELEKAKKEAETKATELSTHFRALQNKVKFMEQKWRDEKEELTKNHKGEHAILEKLTAERQALDTRVHLMNNILDEQKKNYEIEQGKLRKEVLTVKEQLAAAAVEKQILEDKLKSLHQEVATLSLQQQQAVDVIKNTMDADGNHISENESQLNTEVLALRVALKAAQDRIETYTTEKMRFIDSIEKLNCSGDAKECLAKALVQKEEVITQLEHESKQLNQEIEDQRLTIQQLKVQIDNLQAGAIVNNLENIPHDTQELQSMLEEGKAKLQKALTKSLDNEQKLIRYEHDMNQQKKQLNDMENLLKVRDGLISMLKMKKDELVMENESLHRYSEEVRQLLFDTKEELKQKAELLDEAGGHLDEKNKLCYKLEKKIRELETTLSETNEKRYKLQDTVGCMEKELQSTKAHINQIAEMQTRYDIGMPQINTDLKLKQKEQLQTVQRQYASPAVMTNNFQEKQEKRIPQKAFIATTGVPSNLTRPMSPNRRLYSPTRPTSLSIAQHSNNANCGFKKNPGHQGPVIPIKQINEHRISSKQLETSHIGDNSPSHIRKMYYYVPECNVQHYANYMRNPAQATSNFMYRNYRSSYQRPLTQSLVDFETTAKIRNTKRNSSPVLCNTQRNAKIQTSSAPKLSSATQTDVQQKEESKFDGKHNAELLVCPKVSTQAAVLTNNNSKLLTNTTKQQKLDDPYKLCCDMLSNERADLEAAAVHDVPETKVQERKEFITVVNRLSQFDNTNARDTLGLGKEFTPIIFGGVCKYKVLNSGSLMWCHPSKEMQINNMIIANDIKAHSTTRTTAESVT